MIAPKCDQNNKIIEDTIPQVQLNPRLKTSHVRVQVPNLTKNK